MPGNTPRSELERIYHLIQDEKLDDAISALRPIVARDPDNEDAWWLYANAVSEPDDARNALDNVLRINPANMEARDLLEKLNEAYRPEPILSEGPLDDFGSSTPDPFDDFFGEDKEPDFAAKSTPAPVSPNYPQPGHFPEPFAGVPLDKPITATPVRSSKPGAEPVTEPEEGSHGGRFTPIFMGVLLLITLLLGAYYVISRQNTAPTPEPTSVAAAGTSLPTLPPAATIEVGAATVVPSTPEPASPIAPTTAGNGAGVTAGPTGEATVAPTTSSGAATEAPTTSAAPTAGPITDALPALTSAIQSAGYSNAAVSIEQTMLGDTLTLKVCANPGAEYLKAVDKTRDLLAAQAAPYASQIGAIGVQITNCADVKNILYNRIVPAAVVTSLESKKIDVKKFRASWITP